MPYIIRKIRNEPYYSVKNNITGIIHSSHATKANAMKQVKLLMAIDHGFKPTGSGHPTSKMITPENTQIQQALQATQAHAQAQAQAQIQATQAHAQAQALAQAQLQALQQAIAQQAIAQQQAHQAFLAQQAIAQQEEEQAQQLQAQYQAQEQARVEEARAEEERYQEFARQYKADHAQDKSFCVASGKKGGTKATGCMRVGMGLTKKETQDFITASYAKKKNVKEVNGYKLDRQLSSKQNKVYVNPEGKVVIANAGTSDLLDWTNNAYVPMGLYHTTKRYKDIENIQKKAIEKYGKENITNVGHSQSGEALRNLANRGLTNEAVALNPFILGDKHEGVDVIRSSGDLVSLMTPDVKETIPSKSWNLYTEHMPNVLSRGGTNFGAVLGQIFTGRRRKSFGGWKALSNFGHKLTPALNFMSPAYINDMGGVPQSIGRIGGKKNRKM